MLATTVLSGHGLLHSLGEALGGMWGGFQGSGAQAGAPAPTRNAHVGNAHQLGMKVPSALRRYTLGIPIVERMSGVFGLESTNVTCGDNGSNTSCNGTT